MRVFTAHDHEYPTGKAQFILAAQAVEHLKALQPLRPC